MAVQPSSIVDDSNAVDIPVGRKPKPGCHSAATITSGTTQPAVLALRCDCEWFGDAWLIASLLGNTAPGDHAGTMFLFLP